MFQRRRSSVVPTSKFDSQTQDLIQQWENLSNELNTFEQSHRVYLTKLEQIEKLKKEHRMEFNRMQKKLQQLNKSIEIHPQSSDLLDVIHRDSLKQRSNYFKRIAYTLPQSSERYLRIILGSELPVSILDKSDQWRYKESYEGFKLRVTLIIMIVSLLMSTLLPNNRALDALFHFLLVWYYCTLTIRESILVVNGSKITLWWRLHHFISTASACLILLWPSAYSYQLFRQQHYIFSLYISFVQVLLYYYQQGLLYRLRALGYSDELQITIEGFQSWTLRGLSFLAPFLVVGYLFHLYNAYVLFCLSNSSVTEPNPDWRLVLKILSFISFVFFLGNSTTMYLVIRRKIRERIPDIQSLQHRYESLKTLLLYRVRTTKPFQR